MHNEQQSERAHKWVKELYEFFSSKNPKTYPQTIATDRNRFMAAWLLQLRDEALRGNQPPSLPGIISSQPTSTKLSKEVACTVTLIVDDRLRVVDLITAHLDLDPDFLSSPHGSKYVHIYWAILCQLAPAGADWGDIDGE